MFTKHFICRLPFHIMKIKNLSSFLAAATVLLAAAANPENPSKLPNDGQLHGVAPGNQYQLPKPPGMVYIPPGTFHMGPSDEDVNYAYTARNKQVSIMASGWMPLKSPIMNIASLPTG